jgi:hypothetical protein
MAKIAENCNHNIDPWSPCLYTDHKMNSFTSRESDAATLPTHQNCLDVIVFNWGPVLGMEFARNEKPIVLFERHCHAKSEAIALHFSPKNLTKYWRF